MLQVGSPSLEAEWTSGRWRWLTGAAFRPGFGHDRCDPGCSFLDRSAPERAHPSQPVIACSLNSADHTERLQQWHALLTPAPLTRTELTASATLDSDRGPSDD